MGDHYVPQHYLRGFASSTDGMIWTYEKNGSIKFPSDARNTGHETNYYSPEVETYLANQIEAPANKVIDKIRSRENLTKEDKTDLATYMVVMLKRVPQSKIRMKEMAPSVAQKQEEKWDQEISKLTNEHPEKASLLEKRRAEIKQNLKKYSVNPPKDFWLSLIPPERSPNVINVLQQMTWHFLTYDEDPVFLTCDNPVFYFTWMGIGKPESEVTFPISSNIVLWATWRKDIEEKYTEIHRQAIKEINRRTATNTTRFVYHARDEYWIPRFIAKKYHALNRLI
ncbi:MAG: DUF4238 domain-containing protein [Desulfobulbaceae bacterium]|nr:DUF4238 domain-containing protein [Desulfobulbaceae bacterium]